MATSRLVAPPSVGEAIRQLGGDAPADPLDPRPDPAAPTAPGEPNTPAERNASGEPTRTPAEPTAPGEPTRTPAERNASGEPNPRLAARTAMGGDRPTFAFVPAPPPVTVGGVAPSPAAAGGGAPAPTPVQQLLPRPAAGPPEPVPPVPAPSEPVSPVELLRSTGQKAVQRLVDVDTRRALDEVAAERAALLADARAEVERLAEIELGRRIRRIAQLTDGIVEVAEATLGHLAAGTLTGHQLAEFITALTTVTERALAHLEPGEALTDADA